MDIFHFDPALTHDEFALVGVRQCRRWVVSFSTRVRWVLSSLLVAPGFVVGFLDM
jgi:anti-sigma factor RsiW